MTRRPRVLIVEDNADLRRLYAIGLNQKGYEVKLAANGAEAVERVETDRPDLIILDLCMPIMDGWEVIEKVNPPEIEPSIPVIIVSGHAAPADRPLPSCVQGWLAKPATIDDVAGKIREISA